jgi:hypothetical protein
MPSPSTESVPASEIGSPAPAIELPAYEQMVALMRQLDECPDDAPGSASSWLEYCEQRGIFPCLTREFAARLADIVASLGPGPCVEVAAGDGTLARALCHRDVPVAATDPHCAVAGIERLSAGEAIARHGPELVIACWPPLGADVEMTVLGSPGVRHFIYIGQSINGQVGPQAMWSHPEWHYSLRADLLAYSLCRFDFFSTRQQRVVKHSYPFVLSRRLG